MIKTLTKCLTSDTKSLFRHFAKTFQNRKYHTDWENYFVVEGDLDFGLVSHIDIVGNKVPKALNFKITGQNKVLEITNAEKAILGADDKAGVATLLCVHNTNPTAKKPWFLFFNYEETGCIGVSNFLNEKKDLIAHLNYFIEFDRRGFQDSVFYDTKNLKFKNFINEMFNTKEAHGSTSDIRKITAALEISSVNISIGYQAEHTAAERLFPSVCIQRVNEVLELCTWEETIGTKSQYKEETPKYKYPAYQRYGSQYYYQDEFFEDDDFGPGSSFEHEAKRVAKDLYERKRSKTAAQLIAEATKHRRKYANKK